MDSTPLAANRLLAGAGDEIVADLGRLVDGGAFRRLESPPAGVHVVGSTADVWVHAEAEIFPGTVLDARGGPIVIDARAQVGQLSYLSGPSYVGPGTHVENCRLVAPVVLGRDCRVGGEIEASFVGDYSNKHHEGFLGHSHRRPLGQHRGAGDDLGLEEQLRRGAADGPRRLGAAPR